MLMEKIISLYPPQTVPLQYLGFRLLFVNGG